MAVALPLEFREVVPHARGPSLFTLQPLAQNILEKLPCFSQ